MSNNDIKKNLESSNFINFSKSYLNLTKDLLDNLDLDTLENIVNLIEDCSKNNNTIYVAGNGGSASTASTFVNDIGFDVYKKPLLKKIINGKHASTKFIGEFDIRDAWKHDLISKFEQRVKNLHI